MFLFLLFITLSFFIFLLRSLFRVIPSHTVAIIERFGGSPRIIHPGPNFIGIPFIDTLRPFHMTIFKENSVRKTLREPFFPTRELNYDVKTMAVTTCDSVAVEVDVTLYVKIVDVIAFAYNFPDPGEYINDVCTSHFATFLSEKSATWIIKSSSEIPNLVRNAIKDPLSECGVLCTRCLIQSISIPEALRKSYERKIAATVESEAKLEEAACAARLDKERARIRFQLESDEMEHRNAMETARQEALGKMAIAKARDEAIAMFQFLEEGSDDDIDVNNSDNDDINNNENKESKKVRRRRRRLEMSAQERAAHVLAITQARTQERLYEAIRDGNAGMRTVVVPAHGYGTVQGHGIIPFGSANFNSNSNTGNVSNSEPLVLTTAT